MFGGDYLYCFSARMSLSEVLRSRSLPEGGRGTQSLAAGRQVCEIDSGRSLTKDGKLSCTMLVPAVTSEQMRVNNLH